MSPSSAKPKAKPPRQQIKLPRTIRLPWLLVIILVVVSLFLLQQYHTAQRKLKAGNTPVASKQVSDVISKVAKLVVVPKDETPTVATVAHADKLRGQTFFANARDGDKVVVYGKEKQAILYRPSTNQIVTISTVQTAPTQ